MDFAHVGYFFGWGYITGFQHCIIALCPDRDLGWSEVVPSDRFSLQVADNGITCKMCEVH